MLRRDTFARVHNEVLELLALSSIEKLTPEEESRITEHVAVCLECAATGSEYKLISGYGLAVANLAHAAHQDDAPWDAEKQKLRLLARVHSHQESVSCSRRTILQRLASPQIFRWSAIAVLLVACSVITGYRFGRRALMRQADSSTQNKAALGLSQPSSTVLKDQMDMQRELARAEQRAEAAETRIAELERERAAIELARAEVENRIMQLSHSVSASEHTIVAANKEKAEATQQIAVKDKLLQTVQLQLSDLREQRSRDLLRAANAEFRLQQISSELNQKDQTIARQQQLLESDRDVRELMGARQLHIADVVDVDKDGQNNKPFGRIFYTKGKSLIFYAFDLDQQPGVRNASVFRAWGQSDGKSKSAISLGIFYLDSETNHRWVVKADSAELLSQLDAVFVTVEKNGSTKRPTGKPFLYTYLRKGAPNHP